MATAPLPETRSSTARTCDGTPDETTSRRIVIELPIRRHPTILDDIAEEDETIELDLSKFVHEEGEHRWRCKAPECTKLFKGEAYWVKHVTKRHHDWLEKLKEDKLDHDDSSSCGSWQEVSESGEDDLEVVNDDDRGEPGPPSDGDYKKLIDTVKTGDINALTSQLEKGLNIDHRTPAGDTLLCYAIEKEQVEIVKVLLQKGANVHLRANGLAPIHYAADTKARGPELIQLLLDHGACLNTPAGPIGSALGQAARDNRADIADFLIKKGIELESVSWKGCTPLLIAAGAGHNDVAKVLLSHDADIDARSQNGGTVLIWSAALDRVDAIRFWLDQGADINATDDDGMTPLLIACQSGCYKAVDLLLERGADTSIVSEANKNYSPIMAAVCSRWTSIVKRLLDHSCDLTAKNSLGQTVLEVAIIQQHPEIIQMLLEAMGGPNYPKDSVSLQIALADDHILLDSVIATASIMYKNMNQAIGVLDWMDWVLDQGGDVMKPLAMAQLLRAACKNLNIEMIRALAVHGCDMNIGLGNCQTPLEYAIKLRHLEMIKVLLDAGADLNLPNRYGSNYTAFESALFDMNDGDDTEVVDILLENGRCHINTGRDSASSTFSYVLDRAEVWSFGLAEILAIRMIESISDVNDDRCANGDTLLHVATQSESLEVVDLLLSKGADIEAKNQRLMTPFILACRDAPKMIRPLMERGANIHILNDSDASALHAAANWGNLESVRILVELGLDMEGKITNGNTPLVGALSSGREEAALYLIEGGASLHWETREKRTPLHYAAARSMCRIVEEILKQGNCDVNAKNYKGYTPLQEACRNGNLEIARMLLDAGADIETGVHSDKEHRRPLELAMSAQAEDLVQYLIQKGADINGRGFQGSTYLHLASRFSLPKVAADLINRGLSTEDETDPWRKTPLHHCVGARMCEVLIERGANVNHTDKSNWTPLHHSVVDGSLCTARELLYADADVNIRTLDDGLNVLERVEELEDDWLRGSFLRLLREMESRKLRLAEDVDEDTVVVDE